MDSKFKMTREENIFVAKRNINIEDNSINIGNKNKIKKSPIGNRNAEKEKDGFFHKYPCQIISGVIIVVVAALICSWLGLK